MKPQDHPGWQARETPNFTHHIKATFYPYADGVIDPEDAYDPCTYQPRMQKMSSFQGRKSQPPSALHSFPLAISWPQSHP